MARVLVLTMRVRLELITVEKDKKIGNDDGMQWSLDRVTGHEVSIDEPVTPVKLPIGSPDFGRCVKHLNL